MSIQAAWAFTIQSPQDWDPAYYRSIARHIVAGEGAVSAALWSLAWRPPSLPMPADLYWMPMPSRVLVPFVAAWPSHGDQVATVLLAATWGPLAWLLARRHPPEVAWLAGILAASGGAFARFLSTPDSVAIYGAVASLAWLAAAEGWSIVAILALCVAALTRNDGFLLVPFVAWLLPDRRIGALALLAGWGTTAAWHLRNAAIVGPSYAGMRAAAANGLDTEHLSALTTGVAVAPTFADRAAFVLTEGVPATLVVWLVVLPPLWFVAKDRAARVPVAFAVLHPLLALALAPGVAASGSLFRSAAAVFPVLCAGAAATIVAIGRWTEARRGYPPWLIPAAIVALQSIFWLGLPILQAQNPSPALPPESCDALADLQPGERVFAPHPLLVEAWCGRASVLLVNGLTPDSVAGDAARYGVRHALVYPSSKDPAFPKDGALLPPGWTRAVRTAAGIERWDAPGASQER